MSDEPRYRVSAPGATDDELTALIAVLAGRAAAPDQLRSAEDRPLAGGWKSYYRTVRTQHAPGRDAWRTSIRF
ncbi:MAG: acyl-CoA carboxylase subunit epsilon [Arachnia sp.]